MIGKKAIIFIISEIENISEIKSIKEVSENDVIDAILKNKRVIDSLLSRKNIILNAKDVILDKEAVTNITNVINVNKRNKKLMFTS